LRYTLDVIELATLETEEDVTSTLHNVLSLTPVIVSKVTHEEFDGFYINLIKRVETLSELAAVIEEQITTSENDIDTRAFKTVDKYVLDKINGGMRSVIGSTVTIDCFYKDMHDLVEYIDKQSVSVQNKYNNMLDTILVRLKRDVDLLENNMEDVNSVLGSYSGVKHTIFVIPTSVGVVYTKNKNIQYELKGCVLNEVNQVESIYTPNLDKLLGILNRDNLLNSNTTTLISDINSVYKVNYSNSLKTNTIELIK
jgi:hypothetical protein